MDKPLRDSSEAEVESLTLGGEASVTGFAVKGTKLSFAVTPPEEFDITDVTARFASTTESVNDEELTVTGENGSYQLSSLTPDSGVVYVDVYYSIPAFIPTYTVTYYGNGNTAGDAPVDGGRYEDKATVTVKGKNTLEKNGFEFLGWSTDQDADQPDYVEDDIFTIDAADVTLYAVWLLIPEPSSDPEIYVVTYDGNGNTAGEAPVDSNLYEDKATVTVLGKNTLEKSGFDFLGWSTDRNASQAEYVENNTFAIDAKNVTLYAVWKQSAPPTWKLIYQYKDRFNEDKQYVVKKVLGADDVDEDGNPTPAMLRMNAPYITDLYKNCVWNVDTAVTDPAQHTTVVTATQTAPLRFIYFDNRDIATGERIEESDSDISVFKAERYYNELFTIEAPETDGGRKFLYWRATDVIDGEKVEGTEKAVCYTAYYSYRVTKDLFVEPVYEEEENDWYITLGRAEYSREQYTDSEGDNKQDYVYSDFLISILTPDQSLVKDKNVQFGMVLERLDDDSDYPAAETAVAQQLISGVTPDSGAVSSVSKDGKTYYIYDQTNLAASLTNMNRIDYYIKFGNTERLRGYKFNAYAYLIVDGRVIVSRDVSMLCIDECGTRIYE